jgi:glycosyltransferase involved in cell wall biosynthesis
VKYLFVHQNFPGQYLHIVRHLQADPANDVVFITEPNANHMPGVRRVVYDVGRNLRTDIHKTIRDVELAAHRAEKVADSARQLKVLGYQPDIIIGHHGWGELLNLVDVWPGVPILGYYEFYYHTSGYDVNFDPEFPMPPNFEPGVRTLNILNHLALALNQHGQSPTRFQMEAYPTWAQAQIKLLPEGVPLDRCCPDPVARTRPLSIGDFTIKPADRLITFVARNLEPYRGYHTLVRALPKILAERPDVKVVMVGGNDVSYGPRLVNNTWKKIFLREIEGKYDASRVLTPGPVPYPTYLQLLQRSDAHVYLSYPFVASWSLREALACGCALVAGDVEPVREFITDGVNGVLTPTLDPAKLADCVLSLLENPKRAQKLRRGARAYAQTHLDIASHIAAFEARIAELVGK